VSCPPIDRVAARRLARGWAAGDGQGDSEARSDGTPAGRWVPGVAVAVVSIIFLNVGYFPEHAGAMDGLLGTGTDLTGQERLSNMRTHRSWIAITTPVLALGCAAVGDVVASQWAESDGGNGHWYAGVSLASGSNWSAAKVAAEGLGGHLACFEEMEEFNAVVPTIAANASLWTQRGNWWRGPWIGGFQDPGSADFAEPDGGWRWVCGGAIDGEQLRSMGNGNPNNFPCCEDRLQIGENYLEPFVNDVPSGSTAVAMIVEWSADCNNNGVVDFGEIRNGLLGDSNANNVPDCCESSAGCCPADLNRDGQVNGPDLGALVAFWGPNPSYGPADVTGDGTVNGSDIAALLAAWGPCGG
jgi:hypothetical protein